MTEEMPLDVAASGFGALEVDEALELRHNDLDVVNTRENPDRVTPSALPGVRVSQDRVEATLAPASWNLIRLRTSR